MTATHETRDLLFELVARIPLLPPEGRIESVNKLCDVLNEYGRPVADGTRASWIAEILQSSPINSIAF